MVWPFHATCRSSARLDGKTAIVTGATAGIGKETALDLARRGARVIMPVRDAGRGEAAAADIRRQLEEHQDKELGAAVGEVVLEQLDLASLRSVRACARRILEREEQINILVNNAGLIGPKAHTEDGHDMVFGVNHLGPFLLTLLLLPWLRASAPSRVVNVASVMYSFSRLDFDDLHCERDYRPMVAYSRSKLANMLFTHELARRLKEAGVEGVTAYCVHPGLVATEIARDAHTFTVPGTKFFLNHVGRYLFLKTPRQGAQTTLHCAVDERAGRESGLYYVDCKATAPFACGRDDAVALRLWDVSVDLVGLRGYDAVNAGEAPSWALLDDAKEKDANGTPTTGAVVRAQTIPSCLYDQDEQLFQQTHL